MTAEKRGKRTVKAAETAFAILEVVGEANGVTLSEIAKELELAKSTVHRYLHTLLELGYLVKQGNRYYPGLQFLKQGSYARNRITGYQLVRRKVDQLAEETNERVQFIVEEHDQGVYVYRELGSHAVQTDPGIGHRVELHATSVGKAILAEWPDDRIRELVERRGLPALTDQTVTDEETLFEHIEAARDRGYAMNREENLDGLCAIGVAISGPDGEVIGGLSISGPIHRMTGDWSNRGFPDKLMGYAKEIELNLRYS